VHPVRQTATSPSWKRITALPTIIDYLLVHEPGKEWLKKKMGWQWSDD
jgi:hypothetical protein